MESFGLDAVNVSFLPSDDGNSTTKSLPLVVSPRWENSLTFLCTWMETNRSFIDEMMLKYGAILLRGFDVASCSDFERAVLSYQPRLSDCYRGTSPRKLEDGTRYIFSAADVPSNFPIAQHLEMSFLPAPPRQLFFSCMKAPNSSGGETALCDFSKVYSELSPELRQKFFDKKIRYTRTHKKFGSDSIFTVDVADMKGWPELFGTSDKEEVERICRDEGVSVHWEGPNNDTFVSILESEAFQHHPITMKPVWHNHSQVFHWTTFPCELFQAFLRTHDVRLLIHCVFVSIISVVKYCVLGHTMGLNASFGDGTPISVLEMHEIRNAVHKNMVYSRWEQGDILCIDNYAVSHGRQPTYDHGRKVVVAWSEALEKANTLTCVEAEKLLAGRTIAGNPQERTPESTLTSEDARTLKDAVFDNQSGGEYEVRAAVNGGDFVNPQELQAALSRRNITLASSGLSRKVHSQPLLLHPSSDFWKEHS